MHLQDLRMPLAFAVGQLKSFPQRMAHVHAGAEVLAAALARWRTRRGSSFLNPLESSLLTQDWRLHWKAGHLQPRVYCQRSPNLRESPEVWQLALVPVAPFGLVGCLECLQC